MEKKFNIVVGEDGTVKLPDAVLEKLEVKPGEEVRFEVDDNFYAVRLLSRIEAERLDYLNWMHNKHCPSIEEMIATVYKGNIIKNLIMDCQSYAKYRPNETTGGIFVSWRRKEELPTGA